MSRYIRTVHPRAEAPIIIDSRDECELIDLLANSDALPPTTDDGDDISGMPYFGRAQDGAIWCIGDEIAFRYVAAEGGAS